MSAELAERPSDSTRQVGERLARFTPRLARQHNAVHSHVVMLLKIVLPATAVGLVLLVLLWPRFNAQEQRFAIPKVVVKPEDLENLKMEMPRFVGLDSQRQPFTVTARMATQAAGGGRLTELAEPKGDITLKNGSWIALEADRGIYDKEGGSLDLDGGVTLFHDRGYELRTEKARVFLTPGDAEGDQAVRGQGPDVELAGQGFRLEAKGERIFLTGQSRIVLYPQGSERGPRGLLK